MLGSLIIVVVVTFFVVAEIVVVVSHHMYSMLPYQYLATDYGIQLLLFTHHLWTCGFLIVGVADYLIRYLLDYALKQIVCSLKFKSK